jgi:maleylpyruvate isomerase
MLKLYDYLRSSASFRVRIALNLKKVDFQAVPVHLVNNGGEQFSEEYSKINPHHLVPLLQDHDIRITQSLAIIEYLDEVYPEPPLLPTNPVDKALVRAMALSIAADIHPLNNLRVLTYLKNEFNISDQQKQQWYQHWITKGFTALEKQLSSSQTTGEFCYGDQPTIADLCLVPQMYNAKRFSCDLSAYPTLGRIDENCRKHSAFIKAWPEETVT